MNCAEYLVDFLISKGVKDVFGYPGGYIVPFIDALKQRENEIGRVTQEVKYLINVSSRKKHPRQWKRKNY